MIAQIFIALFGVTAVFLSQHHCDSRRRWACICGLLSQPFWFYTTWQAQQWGIFGLSFFYAWSWCMGFRNYWLKPATN